MTSHHSVFRVLTNSSSPQVEGDNSVGPSIAVVLCLLCLGVIGTVSNIGLLLAALKPSLAAPALPGPLASALANLAAMGLVESTVNASLSAYYASGGFSAFKTSGGDASTTRKAVLLGTLMSGSSGVAWGVAGVMGSAALQPVATVNLVRFMSIVGTWLTALGLGIANGYVLSGNRAAISSTSLVPRERQIFMNPYLRWTKLALGYILPWVLTFLSGLWGTKKAVMSRMVKVSHGHIANLEDNRTPSFDNLCVGSITLLYILIRVPFEIAGQLSGSGPASMHSSLAWGRFMFTSFAPLFAMTPGGRLLSLCSILGRFCPRSPRPVVSQPPPAHPTRALLRQIALVKPRVSASVSVFTPIIFPTPAGLFLRLPKYQQLVLNPGFSYRVADINPTIADLSEPVSKDSLEKRDVFVRESRVRLR